MDEKLIKTLDEQYGSLDELSESKLYELGYEVEESPRIAQIRQFTKYTQKEKAKIESSEPFKKLLNLMKEDKYEY